MFVKKTACHTFLFTEGKYSISRNIWVKGKYIHTYIYIHIFKLQRCRRVFMLQSLQSLWNQVCPSVCLEACVLAWPLDIFQQKFTGWLIRSITSDNMRHGNNRTYTTQPQVMTLIATHLLQFTSFSTFEAALAGVQRVRIYTFIWS